MRASLLARLFCSVIVVPASVRANAQLDSNGKSAILSGGNYAVGDSDCSGVVTLSQIVH